MGPPSCTLRLQMTEHAAEALLRRLAAGDARALGELFDAYSGLLGGLALRILQSRAEAEDVVQEVFVQVWRQAARFDGRRGNPEAWLCTITRTRALDRLRRRAARRERTGAAAPPGADVPRPEESLAVRQALGELSPEQRRALELAYYEGLTHAEIARRLGEPLGTIKTRIRTAMTRLRDALRPVPS